MQCIKEIENIIPKVSNKEEICDYNEDNKMRFKVDVKKSWFPSMEK